MEVGEDQEKAVLERIASMPQPDRAMAERIHAIVTASAPDLEPRTGTGYPRTPRVARSCAFFQDAAKFKARYATFTPEGGQATGSGPETTIWRVECHQPALRDPHLGSRVRRHHAFGRPR